MVDPLLAARVIVFAFVVVVAFVDRCRLAWVIDPFARAAILIIIALLTCLDLPLALLVAVGYLQAEIHYRTFDVQRDAARSEAHRCRQEFDQLRRGMQSKDDEVLPAAPSVPFLTEDNLRAAAEGNLVPGTRQSDGIRFGEGWLSAQGVGDAVEPIGS